MTRSLSTCTVGSQLETALAKNFSIRSAREAIKATQLWTPRSSFFTSIKFSSRSRSYRISTSSSLTCLKTRWSKCSKLKFSRSTKINWAKLSRTCSTPRTLYSLKRPRLSKPLSFLPQWTIPKTKWSPPHSTITNSMRLFKIRIKTLLTNILNSSMPNTSKTPPLLVPLTIYSRYSIRCGLKRNLHLRTTNFKKQTWSNSNRGS